MKTTVIVDELRLCDVRPDLIAQEYAALRRDEALTLIGDENAAWTGRPYPNPDCAPESAFVRDGLSFQHCKTHGTIFASPVPTQETLDTLVRDGASAQLRRRHFEQRFSESQRASTHAPVLRWAHEIIDEYNLIAPEIGLVGNDETGLATDLADKIQPARFILSERISAQPAPAKAEVIDAEMVPPEALDLAFDIGSLERVANPLARIALWSHMLKPGGFIAFTTSTASGLEYRLLGPDAPSFIALDRLTMYSVPALDTVLRANGFEVVELSTPGRVDVESLSALFETQEASDDPLNFWRYLFRHGDQQMRADLQTFLQRHRLSSYARVLARKL